MSLVLSATAVETVREIQAERTSELTRTCNRTSLLPLRYTRLVRETNVSAKCEPSTELNDGRASEV